VIQRIKPEQVRMGMYVRRLGGSFFRHPFWRTRFMLTAQSDVELLRNCAIPYVEIDASLGCGPADAAEPQRPAPSFLVDRIGENRGRQRSRPAIKRAGPMTRAERAAHGRAARSVARGKAVVEAMFETARLGGAVPVTEALELVEEIDDLFERGEYMLLDAVQMKTADEYTYLHSVAVCALMLKLARQLGLPTEAARECGLAGLLHDVGKMRVPAEVLHKRAALTDDEFELVKAHAEEGFLILRDVAGLPATAMEVARLHHEKIDGTGYPLGLTGEEIPMIAKMGAICDVYDALTSNRAYKAAWTPAKALETMAAAPGHFDAALLQSFAQCIEGAVLTPEEAQADPPETESAVPAQSACA
jgi:putative nucleotidyltransferase with HDIG domain